MQQFPKETLNELKNHLSEEKIRLEARIKELSSQDPFRDPDRAIDNAASDTEANEESNHDRVSALVDELNTKLTSVRQALVRIEEGTYGFCTVCKAMIDTDRLSVLPTATLCLKHEKEAKRKHSISA